MPSLGLTPFTDLRTDVVTSNRAHTGRIAGGEKYVAFVVNRHHYQFRLLRMRHPEHVRGDHSLETKCAAAVNSRGEPSPDYDMAEPEHRRFTSPSPKMTNPSRGTVFPDCEECHSG
jgi:hypothetical protein